MRSVGTELVPTAVCVVTEPHKSKFFILVDPIVSMRRSMTRKMTASSSWMNLEHSGRISCSKGKFNLFRNPGQDHRTIE